MNLLLSINLLRSWSSSHLSSELWQMHVVRFCQIPVRLPFVDLIDPCVILLRSTEGVTHCDPFLLKETRCSCDSEPLPSAFGTGRIPSSTYDSIDSSLMDTELTGKLEACQKNEIRMNRKNKGRVGVGCTKGSWIGNRTCSASIDSPLKRHAVSSEIESKVNTGCIPYRERCREPHWKAGHRAMRPPPASDPRRSKTRLTGLHLT